MRHPWITFFLVYLKSIVNSSILFKFPLIANDITVYCGLEGIDTVNTEPIINSVSQSVHSWSSVFLRKLFSNM